MTRKTLLVFAAATSLAAVSLAACETDSYGPAGASAERPLNRDCRPGNTDAGTRSGKVCDPGSSTGTAQGSDANVQGAGTAGSAPSAP